MVRGPVSKRRYSRLAVRRMLLAAAAFVVTLLVLLGAWVYFSSSHEASQKLKNEEVQARARDAAGTIGAAFAAQGKELSKLAREPEVVSLFEQGDAIEIAGRAAEYEARFDQALNLRFLLPGSYTLDASSRPPLSYACLDMLNKAEKSAGHIGMEVHLYGGEDQHIVMVERVRNQANQLIGLVHLSLDTALFEQAVSGLDLTDAYVELHQSSGGQALQLASHGNSALKSGSPAATASITNSRWSLAYWGGDGSTARTAGNAAGGGILIPAGGVVLILLLLAGGFVYYRRGRSADAATAAAAEEEPVVYGGAVRNIMNGAHPGMESLVPDLPGGNSGGDKSGGARPSEALTGDDDITMVMRKQDRGSDTEASVEIEDADSAAGNGETGATTEEKPSEDEAVKLDPGIFRAYDIRGVVGENLTEEIVTRIGRAIGSEALAINEQAVVVGRDGRKSSPDLAAALIKGLRGAGCTVIDIGEAPTPVLYFATHTLEAKSGVMVTGSHNGPEYNGLKIVLKGETLSEAAIRKIYERITEDDLASGEGGLETAEVIPDYVRRISEDIPVALGSSYKLVVDCGNGVAGLVAPQLFRALGHDVVELYCDVDGSFPNHHPDPSQPDNLAALIDKVRTEEADLGFAFDGDGDRLGVVDGKGNIIWPDRQLMVLARDVLSRNAGAEIIFDVKCSRYLKGIIESSGGKPLMWKTGHSLIKAKMKESGAPLAGEMSGHIFFKERWYGFDDAMYTAARLLEVLVSARASPSEYFADYPEGVSTPELRLDMPEDQHKDFMQELESKMTFEDAEVIKVDGIRVEFSDGWGLIRPSNTSPCLILRFEADSEEALSRIQGSFRDLIQSINPDLKPPF